MYKYAWWNIRILDGAGFDSRSGSKILAIFFIYPKKNWEIKNWQHCLSEQHLISLQRSNDFGKNLVHNHLQKKKKLFIIKPINFSFYVPILIKHRQVWILM